MTVIDPRLAERRRRVQESSLRRRLRRLLGLLAVIAALGAGAWLVWSPFLDVDAIVVSGATQADVEARLAAAGLVEGAPMLLVDGDAVAAALEADPWVADAAVHRIVPGTVEIVVVERRPLAVLVASDGEVVVADDGVVLAVGAPPELARIVVPGPVGADVGATVADEGARAALGFLAYLPDALRGTAVVELTEGEVPGERALRARVGGHVVLLGRPVQMPEKARVLAKLLARPLPDGAEINLLAPTRPAVVPPGGADAEGSTDG